MSEVDDIRDGLIGALRAELQTSKRGRVLFPVLSAIITAAASVATTSWALRGKLDELATRAEFSSMREDINSLRLNLAVTNTTMQGLQEKLELYRSLQVTPLIVGKPR